MWSKVTTAPGWSTQRFNVHSLATALLADMLAARLPAAHPECAFTTGLLHDLGRFMIATATPDEYETIDRLHAQGQRSLQECEIAVIGVGHDVLSAAALARWRLPQPIHDAVNTHHSQSLPVTMPAPGRVLPLGAILLLANRLASATGYALNELDAQGALPPEHILAGTGLERELDTLLTEFQAEFGVLRGTL
jgi:putative nucleotidyltransferase with HDIG domain